MAALLRCVLAALLCSFAGGAAAETIGDWEAQPGHAAPMRTVAAVPPGTTLAFKLKAGQLEPGMSISVFQVGAQNQDRKIWQITDRNGNRMMGPGSKRKYVFDRVAGGGRLDLVVSRSGTACHLVSMERLGPDYTTRWRCQRDRSEKPASLTVDFTLAPPGP